VSIRNPKREELWRLESKTLGAQFKTAIQEGLNCSPFEAEAVLGVVREIYFPYMEPTSGSVPPGKITLVAVCADEPAGKAVADCEKRSVCLTVHRGLEDDKVMQAEGPAAYRQGRIVDLCQEALSQGALLTREDLAYRVFFVNVRTISRDLEALRRADPERVIPLRSTIHDIGPVLTHRVQIVRLALEGHTTTEICRRMRHSAAAVTNYVSTFTRCAQLARRDMQAGQIAFLLRRSRKLIEQYLDVLHECASDKNLGYHLKELLRLGHVGGGKKQEGRSADASQR
jgi:DNA-binding CsgD family transcriptional regulator